MFVKPHLGSLLGIVPGSPGKDQGDGPGGFPPRDERGVAHGSPTTIPATVSSKVAGKSPNYRGWEKSKLGELKLVWNVHV